MSISQYHEHRVVSIVPHNAVSDYDNHFPLSVVDVTKNGVDLTVHIYRGTKFTDGDGNALTPEGYLTLEEYFYLEPMLGYVKDDGTVVERTLSYDWNEIDAVVMRMRQWKAAAAESFDQQTPPPEEQTNV